MNFQVIVLFFQSLIVLRIEEKHEVLGEEMRENELETKTLEQSLQTMEFQIMSLLVTRLTILTL